VIPARSSWDLNKSSSRDGCRLFDVKVLRARVDRRAIDAVLEVFCSGLLSVMAFELGRISRREGLSWDIFSVCDFWNRAKIVITK
jgi:hypothetical protein